MSRAIAQVDHLVPYARSDQAVRFGSRHTFCHLFQLFDLEETTDARTDVAVFDERRSFRHRFVSAVQIHRQNADARMLREVTDDRLVVSHDAGHRTRAFREDERVVTLIEERAGVAL